MICNHCKSDIDNDSFHCDQCGKELFICPTCGKTGKGKNCVEDGSKLFSPKQKSAATSSGVASNQNNTPSVFESVSILNSTVDTPSKNQPPVFNDNSSAPVLRIINNYLQIDIELKDGDIIGRITGNHVSTFKQFSQISGRHAQFIFDKNNGWAFKDLGSTNGSAINKFPNWQNTPKLEPNTLEVLSNNCFLLLANIEFQVKIISNTASSGTQRL